MVLAALMICAGLAVALPSRYPPSESGEQMAMFVSLALLELILRAMAWLAVHTGAAIAIAAYGLVRGRLWGYWSSQTMLVLGALFGLLIAFAALIAGEPAVTVFVAAAQIVYCTIVFIVLRHSRDEMLVAQTM